MVTEILLGTMAALGMAGGISALVLIHKQNGNGHRDADPWRREPESPQPPAPAPPVVNWPPELASLLAHITERLERSLERQETDYQDFLQRLTEKETHELQSKESQVPPEWAAHMQMDIAQMRENSLLEPLWPATLIATVQELGEKIADMAAIEAAPVVLAPPDNTALLASSEKLEDAVQSLPSRIGQQLSEVLARMPRIAGGSSPPRAPRPAPANLPRITPSMQPAVPQIPASYVSGTVLVPAGQPASLLLLIQMQLDPNCPGTSAELTLSTEDDIFVGAASKIGGPLSATNFAYQLTSENSPRTYRSTFPGNNTPLGELQVFSSGGGSLNVEVHQ